ncbi:HAD-IA family hydrolase [Caldibacillus lycopersici]|uniref:HAD-IA family hydrolase n=1 Tax=Perspicuibacillus lycopersici TaxID=1325689 RepID=A0AAE3LQ15_9BACI|nr:HAD-IA family hydrolase [Perspicuibacillus lycopersici]MCU9612939.1 HAD-IA family hydrolase [Perspicuibacillus lycopersici]
MTVLWDFDGTLFDTYPMYTELLQEEIKEEIPDELVLQQLKVSFRHAVAHFGLTSEQVERIRIREGNIMEGKMEKLVPFPGVEKILQSVGKNVIMTHKHRADTEKILGYYGWNQYFTEIVSGDDGFPRKPDPASYEYLHKRHHLNLVIGDRLLDILPGKKLGIKTCLFQNHEQGADFYLDDFAAFFEKVGKYL